MDRDMMRELFGEPIAVYTDEQALADGVLVDISGLGVCFRGRPVNRMTGGLWAAIEPFVGEVAALDSILRAKLRYAGVQGGIWHVPPGLWLIENEVGGWTFMRPEDN